MLWDHGVDQRVYGASRLSPLPSFRSLLSHPLPITSLQTEVKFIPGQVQGTRYAFLPAMTQRQSSSFSLVEVELVVCRSPSIIRSGGYKWGKNIQSSDLAKLLKKKKLFSSSHRASNISVGSQNSDTSVPKRNEHTLFVLIRIKLTAAWSISYKNIIDMIEGIFKVLKVTTGLSCHSWCPFYLASST